MIKNIPIYEISIDLNNEETTVSFNSLVHDPAHEISFQTFANVKRFEFNDVEQVISGVAISADTPIYRYDSKTKEEYYVMFTKEIIEKLHHNFNKNNRNAAINIMHSDKMAEAYVTENWLIEDKEHDKSKIYGFDLPIVTSFGLVNIESKEFWESEIKTGNLRGFSIEAFLQRKEKPINTIKMSTQASMFVETTLADGRKLKVSEEGAVVGSDVMEVAEDGTETPMASGEYELEDGSIIVVAEGKITEIKDKEPMAEEPNAPATPEVDVEAMVNEKIEALKVEMQNALAEIVAKLTEMEAGKAKAEDEVEEMKAQFAQFSEIPAVKSLFTKNDKVNAKPNQYSELERLRKILPTKN